MKGLINKHIRRYEKELDNMRFDGLHYIHCKSKIDALNKLKEELE